MKPTRNPSVQTKLLPDGHVVLFSEQVDWAHTLTPLAAIAWEFCDGDHNVDQIAECVSETAGTITTEAVKPELTKLFEELISSGLILDN